MIKKTMIFTIFIFSLILNAEKFSVISKRLAFLEFPNGKNALGAISVNGDKCYVFTTQSVFLQYGTDFVLKDFENNRLNVRKMEICPDLDLIRFEIDINYFIKHFKLAEEPKSMYQINPYDGTVSEKDFSLKTFPEPGTVVVAEDGALVGLVSFTDGYSGKKCELVKITGENKWSDTTIRTFGTQISKIVEMKEKILSIESLKKVNKMHSYIEYLPKYHESHVSWVNCQNEEYEKAVFNEQKGKSMGAAKFKHESRCKYFTSLKRLSIFAGDIIQTDFKTKWQSKFLKGLTSELASRAEKVKKACKKEMDKIQKAYPATKVKN